MKTLMRVLFVLVPFLFSVFAMAQQQQNKDCETSCFSTEIIAAEKISETCTSYTWRVSYEGRCSHALSHFTVAIPCGEIKDLRNSESWKQELGTDPTTGLSGFKIDDIPNFGETSLRQFTINFTLCTTNSDCSSQLRCWKPVVAYKASNCIDFDTLSVNCQALRATIQTKDVSCYGYHDGEMSVIVEGQEPYRYLWSTGASTPGISDLSPLIYSVEITDATGAKITLADTIHQPDPIVISGNITNSSCNGVADGSINIDVKGGNPNYTFQWSNGTTLEDLNSIKAGMYSVIVTDVSGCSAQARFSVASVSQPIVTATQKLPDCTGTNGAIYISVSGGSSPYTYQWSNGTTLEDLENVGAGIYKVTVTESGGCTTEVSYNLKENNTLKLSYTITQTSCQDDASGAVDLTVTGGTSPYTYLWGNGSTSEDISGLSSGYYIVVVTDANGCTATVRVFISKRTFQVPSQIIQPVCPGDSTGSITLLNPIGGQGPFTYIWSAGQTESSITGLAPGIYSVVVTDSLGCSRELYFGIINPSGITATAIVSNDQCNANNYFEIDLTVSGGTMPYSFIWSNGADQEDIDSLSIGTYSVTITDANGCSVIKDIEVAGTPPDWSCAIVPLSSLPNCGSINNSLFTSTSTAESYEWVVQSSDGGWAITEGAFTDSIHFTAGTNSSATFNLTIRNNGCTQTCSYTISECVNADGGGEPGEDPGGGSGDEDCDECFNTGIILLEGNGSCNTYEITVGTNGNCRHDLSHWDIAIPCGNVSQYSNSEGWKMEFGKDPTTGLYGLKVDDIDTFGKSVDSFTVTFTLCYDNLCGQTLSEWNPIVAYKAGTCVAYDTVHASERNFTSLNTITVYPNPFNESLNVQWKNDQHDFVKVELLDQFGNSMMTVFEGETNIGQQYKILITLPELPRGIYYYRYISAGKTFFGKLHKN